LRAKDTGLKQAFPLSIARLRQTDTGLASDATGCDPPVQQTLEGAMRVGHEIAG